MKLRQYDIFGDYTDELVTSTGDDYADFTAKFEPKKTTADHIKIALGVIDKKGSEKNEDTH